MRFAIIGCVGLPAKYGGWETLADHLTRQLSSTFDITVFCSANKYEKQLKVYNGANLVYINLDANGVQSIPYDIISMIKAVYVADTLLILGVSGCIFLPLLKLFTSKKIIVNIDGLEWKRQKWGRMAKWFLKLSESVAVRTADVVVSDNDAIKSYVSKQYNRDSILIAYGADHVQKIAMSESVILEFPFLNSPYAFKVCRIEPENSLDLILDSFVETNSLKLVIVGNWKNSQYGIELKEKYKNYAHINLLDPIYDQNILNQIRSNCAVYIHGHSAGGTNPSLVEAMYLGLPVIAFDVEYNRATTFNKARYFSNSCELKSHLSGLADFQEVVADEMLLIAKENYTWNLIAQKYANILK